jgi:hypothetical protein
MKKGGWKHSDETRSRMAARMTDAERARISEQTKARMADPAVREKIQAGMRAASGEAVEVQMLNAAWRSARPAARKRFLAELTSADSSKA